MLRFNIAQLFRAALIALFISIGSQKSGFAQVVPDDTLGAESSVLGNGRVEGDAVQMIEGGATRGGNLFHSFSEFNIGAREEVYFANPSIIDNILSRVTGNSLSTIDGVLGVDGSANLFLLNPNGIMFGPEAQLDIKGSFTASTAGSFGFENGEEFSAVASETSLLSVSVPLGLQLNTQSQGDLTNAAFLSVGQGENLYLIGSQVSTSVQLSAPGGTAQVLGNQIELIDRETATPSSRNSPDDTELIVQATEGITIPDVSDDELRFLDDSGDIQLVADANTDGIGNLRMVDVQDSLRASGRDIDISGVNITLGGVDTSSVNLEDEGDISISTISDDIRTRDLDSSSDLSSGDIGDGGAITISSTSGNISTQSLNSSSFSFSDQADSGNGGAITISSTSGNISTQSLNSSSYSSRGQTRNGGDITLSSISGNISTQGLDSSSYSFSEDSGNGGKITISSTSGDVRTQYLDSSSLSIGGYSCLGGSIIITSTFGNISTQSLNSSSLTDNFPWRSEDGGDITISSTSGNISTQDLNSSSISPYGDIGEGGAITISSTSGNISTQTIRSHSDSVTENGRNGGAITISSTSGNISTQSLSSESESSYGDTENGGDITISSTSGNISTQWLDSSSVTYIGNSGNGGDITISSTSGNIIIAEQISTRSEASGASGGEGDGKSGDGGAVTISSTSGDIRIQGARSDSNAHRGDSGAGGNGGDITISSISGDITNNQRLFSNSRSSRGESGNGGAITISSISGDIRTQGVDSSSFSYLGNSANGGSLSISSAMGNIRILDNLSSFSLASSISKAGGNISIAAEEGSIAGSEGSLLFSSSVSDSGEITSSGGEVMLHSDHVADLNIITLASGGRSGDVYLQSLRNDLTINDLSVVTTAQVEIPDPRRPERTITVDLRNIGQSGNTSLVSLRNIELNNFSIQSDANGRQGAGNISIESPSQITFNNSQINSSANGSGAAGNMRIDAARLSLGEGDRLLAATSAAGTGGTITINTTESVSLGEGVKDSAPIISVEASGSGRPGNIVINTPNFVLSETARITATSTATATNPDGGGSIDLNANQMDLAGTVGIFAETQGQAPGGILTLQPYQANLSSQNGNQILDSGIASDVVLSSGSSFDLTLAENSLISASTSCNGNCGGLQVLAPEAFTICGPGRLAVESSGSGPAGNITATARSLTLADEVVLSASTIGEGNAGDIDFNISDQLTIDNSTVESRTAPNSTGQGGNINVNDAGLVSLLNGGNFTLNSEGTGEGGNFTLAADALTLDSSQITAITQSSNGGDFTFNLDDALLLRNGSLISTEAGKAGAAGNGGSIDINIPNGFIIAVPEENSDIRANAFEGDGGNINIAARNLLGIAFRPGISDTPSSDITSSSQFGSSGTVTIDELNPESLQLEDDLPVETAPATVARGCRGQGSRTGSFVSTGRGGLPSSPVDALSANTIWQDLAPLESLEESSVILESALENPNKEETALNMNEPIIEAQGWQLAADGTVTLLAEHAEPATHLSQANMCGS